MRDLYLSSNAVQYAIKAQDAIIREMRKTAPVSLSAGQQIIF